MTGRLAQDDRAASDRLKMTGLGPAETTGEGQLRA